VGLTVLAGGLLEEEESGVDVSERR
jgi:hypothetical protein